MSNSDYESSEKSEVSLNKKRKRGRHKKSSVEFNLDMDEYKSKIMKKMEEDYMKKAKYNLIQKSKHFPGLDYEGNSKYILQGILTQSIFVVINKIINNAPAEIRVKYNIQQIMIRFAKILSLNELELTYFALTLDNLGWTSENCGLEENLFITATCVKIYLNSNYEEMLEFICYNTYFKIEIGNLDLKINQFNSLCFAPKEVNEKYVHLTRSVNAYCRENFIDFNFMIDQIIRLSFSYNDNKLENENFAKKKKEKKKCTGKSTSEGKELKINKMKEKFAKIHNKIEMKNPIQNNPISINKKEIPLTKNFSFSDLFSTKNKSNETCNLFDLGLSNSKSANMIVPEVLREEDYDKHNMIIQPHENMLRNIFKEKEYTTSGEKQTYSDLNYLSMNPNEASPKPGNIFK